jgi:hypothetical protein
VASTKLRLLLDESITEPLASLIVGLVQSVERSTSIAGFGAKDGIVAACANTHKRTLVAIDSDFKNYKIDRGVIRISSSDRADDHCLYQIFYAFWISGLRSSSLRRRTFLTQDGVRIHNGKTIERRWKPKPCSKAKGAIKLIAAPKPTRKGQLS